MLQSEYNEASAFNADGSPYNGGGPLETREAFCLAMFLAFGLILFSDDGRSGRVAHINNVELVLDADITTGNTFAFTITATKLQDGSQDVTNVSQLFVADHDNTMTLTANQAAANDGVATAVVSDANNRTLTLAAAEGYELSVTAVSVSGSVNVAQTNDDTGKEFGISAFMDKEPYILNGVETTSWEYSEMMGVHKQGNFNITPKETMNFTDTLYVELSGADKGKIKTTPTATTKQLTRFSVYKEAAADSKGVISVNLP